MSHPTLCSACLEHFTFERPDLAGEIRRLQQAAVDAAVAAGCSETHIQTLRDSPFPWRARWRAAENMPLILETVSIWNDEHSRTMGQLRKGASVLGCPLCDSLIKMVEYGAGKNIPESTRLGSWMRWGSRRGGFVQLHFFAYGDGWFHNEKISVAFDFECSMIDLSNPSSDPANEGLTDYPGTVDGSIDFFSRNLDQCIREHPECSSMQTRGWAPTRLLDVQPDQSDAERVVLVQRRELEADVGDEKIQYLTLSHVWGPSRPFCLTRDNYAHLRGGFGFSELPQCYRDAVFLARKLGIRYIWIDSLCIIQDSIKDWECEASTMDRVYTNGICNIAACDGPDSSYSLFPRPDAGPSVRICVQAQFETGLAYLEIDVANYWEEFMDNYSPLYQRGWVVQEKVLSTRIMHFSIIGRWECPRMTVTEAHPEGDLPIRRELGRTRLERGWISNTQQDPSICLERWLETVTDYSKCSLTFSRDKLVAIGGIARKASSIIKEEYCAGIWGGTLLARCLLWRHLGKAIRQLPTEYQGPSWSWASTNELAIYNLKGREVGQVFIRDASFCNVLDNGNPFGQVTFAELRITGRLLKIPDFESWLNNFKHLRQRRLDQGREVDLKKPTCFLPLARVRSGIRETRYIEGIFVQEAVRTSQQAPPTLQRVGLGHIREFESVSEGDTFADDEAWDNVFDIPVSDIEDDMETITLV